MANLWLRLWHDMPNDPKWRTIARISGEPLSLVLSVYLHLLVDGSRNYEKPGKSTIEAEDLASALDVTEKQVQAVLGAMESRVIVNGMLSDFDRCIPTLKDMGVESSRPSASVWRAIRNRIFARDACQYCGERGKRLECDHVMPVVRGGGHEDGNLATACFDCNRSKRSKTVAEWRAKK